MPFMWVPKEQMTERRRASDEYGPKRKSKPKPPGERLSPWQRHMRRSRRVWKGTRRFYRRHKRKRGAIAAGGGLIGLAVLALMWALQGTVSLVTVGVCTGAVVGGYALEHHDYAKTMRSAGPRASKADRERLRHAWGQRGPYRRPAAPEEPETGRVRVRSHRRDGDGVSAHYRRRPGQAAGEVTGGGWSASDSKANPAPVTPSRPPTRPSTPTPPPKTQPKPKRGPRKRGASGRVLRQTENPNSNESDVDLKAKGKCQHCGGRGFWNSHGTPGEWRHTYCPHCGA